MSNVQNSVVCEFLSQSLLKIIDPKIITSGYKTKMDQGQGEKMDWILTNLEYTNIYRNCSWTEEWIRNLFLNKQQRMVYNRGGILREVNMSLILNSSIVQQTADQWKLHRFSEASGY